ncbi:MAG: hypothetical protein L0216_20725 [Planctomycetales bacterium]|nr:hypothetical protein [Planctomycetales bacterium]
MEWSLRASLDALKGVFGGAETAKAAYAVLARVELKLRSSQVTIEAPGGRVLTRGWFRHDAEGLAQMRALLRAQPFPRRGVVKTIADGKWMAAFLREKCGYADVRIVNISQVGGKATEIEEAWNQPPPPEAP